MMRNLLIVDDDLEFSTQLERIAQDRYQVTVMTTHEKALSFVKDFPVSAILLDYVMPEGNAASFIQKVRTLGYTSPVLIMSAHAEKFMAIECLNLGVKGMIEKPFGQGEFRNFLAAHLSPPAPTTELNPLERTLRIGDELFKLTDIEFEILNTFLSAGSEWICRDQFIRKLWGDDRISRNVFDTHLSNLKMKVPRLRAAITNIRGRGYSLNREKIL